jgi:diazepam-binding inhibitor (GABA receptor modulating acyl-CoA-binding protein)
MSIEKNDLKNIFEKSAEAIKNSDISLSNDELSILYGYYKQATCGDCNIESPSFFYYKKKAKYDAWNKNKGMSEEKAMKLYIKEVKKIFSSH